MNLQTTPQIKSLKLAARERGVPLFGAFELTARCNLNCKMCYVHVMDEHTALRHELTTEQWLSIMDDAYDAGMMFALLTGGECLLRPDFKKLYLHLYQKGVYMSVNTNGVLLTDETVDFFAQHRPERIQISLYGSCDDAYESVTEKRVFERVRHALLALKQRGLPIEVAVTPSKYLYDDFENIIRFLIDEKIKYTVSAELIEPREGVTREPYALTPEESIQLRQKERLLLGNPVIPRSVDELPKPCGSCSEKRYGMPCNAGTIRFVINWKGEMVPCTSIDTIKIDLKGRTFAECWQYINTTMRNVPQAIECIGCAYEKSCTFCPVHRYKNFSDGHCDPNQCELTLNQCAAGLISPKK